MDEPDTERAREQYRAWAPRYDRAIHNPMMRRVRADAVRALDLTSGATVLDVACGTGASFGALQAGVGPGGRIIGVDLSADMLAIAEQRVRAAGWTNVTLVRASIDAFTAPGPVDAALFVLTHDVMRQPAAVDRVVGQVRPGGRIVSVGAKDPPRWAVPLRVALRFSARRAITTTEGLAAPWSHLEAAVPGLRVESRAFGMAYLARGDAPSRVVAGSDT